MRFKLRGKDYEIDAVKIVSAARGFPPDPPDGRNKYFLPLEGGDFPIKQLIGAVTRLPRVAFTAQDAHRILTKLGYEVQEYDESYEPVGPSVEEFTLRSSEGNHMKFAVSLERDEDGFIVASCPALSGCHSQGRTRQLALRNIAEAIRGYAASMKNHGEDLPNVDWEVVEVEV